MTTVHHGDCRDVLRELGAASVDVCITDPPYGLKFMGKGWDHGVPGVEFWALVLRVLTAGSYLLAFGGTRTYHRLACAIEDAGFEIHDCLSWLYGSGFPKHKSKLKPAWEPIVMARKPAKTATLLNIDACRVATEPGADLSGGVVSSRADGWDRPWKANADAIAAAHARSAERRAVAESLGRWPANVLLDEAAAAALDEQTGELTSGFMAAGTKREGIGYHGALGCEVRNNTHGDTGGGASRFFYTAKASRSERERGLENAPRKAGGSHSHSTSSIGVKNGRNRPVGNHHPTVKPVDLMRWLVRLVTPPNGLVLDPFTGSGTTGVAAVLEDRRFVGIEREQEYVEIAQRRISRAAEQGSLFRDVDVA